LAEPNRDLKNKNEFPIYKKVSTVNGYSIIKYYHMLTIFDTRYTFYEIDGLKSDFLIGYNLLKKIGAVIDKEKGVMRYGGKEEKLIYYNDSFFHQLSLSEVKNILQLKESIVRKYFEMKRPKSEMSLKRQIKAKQVWIQKS